MTPHDRWLEPDEEPEVCEICGGHGQYQEFVGTQGDWDVFDCPKCEGLTDAELKQKEFDNFDPPDNDFGEPL